MTTPTYCTNCGRRVHSKRGGYCEPCGHMPKPSNLTDSDALVDGEWVLDPARRVKVWVPVVAA